MASNLDMALNNGTEAVELANIEAELCRLWDAHEGSGRVRACLFNLVAYSQDARRLDYLQELVRMVVQRFPCRILFIHGSNEQPDYLRTSVSAEISDRGDTSIACDRITIEAGGKHLERVPFIVLPHLIPDLPVYLLWGGDPTTDSSILPRLESIADRFIFDSDFSDDLHHLTTHLYARLSQRKRDTVDITWAKLRAWRDVTAEIFGEPEQLQHLAAAKLVEISYNSHSDMRCAHSHLAATYFQAWLAAQMTWKPLAHEESEGHQRISYTNGLQRITVVLKPKPHPTLPPAVLMNVSIQTHDDLHYQISRVGVSRMVQVDVSTPHHCALPTRVALSSLDRGSMIMKETFYVAPSEHYRNTLRLLADLGEVTTP